MFSVELFLGGFRLRFLCLVGCLVVCSVLLACKFSGGDLCFRFNGVRFFVVLLVVWGVVGGRMSGWVLGRMLGWMLGGVSGRFGSSLVFCSFLDFPLCFGSVIAFGGIHHGSFGGGLSLRERFVKHMAHFISSVLLRSKVQQWYFHVSVCGFSWCCLVLWFIFIFLASS